MARVRADIYEGSEYAVVDNNETSDWFKIKSGVKQGCVLSVPVLAGRGLGHEEDNSRQAKRNTVEFTTVLGDFDLADDIAFLSSKINDLPEKTERLTNEAARIGLKLNAGKCKTLRTENEISKERSAVNGEQLENVADFVYQGAYVDTEGGTVQTSETDCTGHLFKTLVRSVLPYGCEGHKTDERKLDTFQYQCLRQISRIRWQQKVKNTRVAGLTDINSMSCEVRRKGWNWLGHALRRWGENDCITALGWRTEGRRARGRPKTT